MYPGPPKNFLSRFLRRISLAMLLLLLLLRFFYSFRRLCLTSFAYLFYVDELCFTDLPIVSYVFIVLRPKSIGKLLISGSFSFQNVYYHLFFSFGFGLGFGVFLIVFLTAKNPRKQNSKKH